MDGKGTRPAVDDKRGRIIRVGPFPDPYLQEFE